MSLTSFSHGLLDELCRADYSPNMDSGSVVIDTHTHLLPDRLAQKIRAFFDEHLAGSLAYEAVNSDVIESHASHGVTEVWNLPYAHIGDMSSKLNADIAKLSAAISTDQVKVRPGCTAHPEDEDPAAIVREAITEHGAVVCKLHCSVGRYDVDDSRLDSLYDTLAELSVPVVIHLGHNVTGMTATEEIAPLLRVAERHPDTTLIAAHCGHSAANAVVDAMLTHANIWADTAPVVQHPIPLDGALLAGVADRILFGSDAPNVGLHLQEQLDHVRVACEGHPDAFNKITHQNALRLSTKSERQ